MDRDGNPSVSVVIPSIGRPSLARAVLSAGRQTLAPAEIIVAMDRGDPGAPALPGGMNVPVRVIYTGGRRGANGARNMGVAAANGDFIALLDDDDEWRDDKLAVQLADVERLRLRTSDSWLYASAIRVTGDVSNTTWPRASINDGQAVATYLFAGRWRTISPTIQPSTWLAPRGVFVANPFAEHVGLHDDWDWLIRTQHRVGLRVLASREALTTYRLGGPDSIVATSRWRDSLEWVSDPSLPLSNRLRADFLVTEAHRVALQTQGRREAVRVIFKAVSFDRPSAPALVRACLRTAISRHHRIRRQRGNRVTEFRP